MSENSIVNEFLVESYENLDQLDRDLVTLEQDPTDREVLDSVFRTIHTIKGTSGFLAFSKLEAVAHVGESLLSKLRDGELQLNAAVTSALLGMVDAVRQMLGNIETSGSEGDGDYANLIETLGRLQAPPSVEAFEPSSPQVAPGESVEGPRLGEILVDRHDVSFSAVCEAVQQQMGGDPRRIGEILIERDEIQPEQMYDALKVQGEARAHSITDNNIRVDVSLLDKLMNLVGELVLARNQILQYTVTQQDATFVATTQRLNLITTELQEGVMKTRMQPIGNVWSKFPRVVRDLAIACGKQVSIEMDGRETELDKTIIEAIKDPLTHLVRNAVDHGVETPERRVACGKPAEGRLYLRAFHEGGQVNIEISDDGSGVDPERVKKKAVDRGLVSVEQAGRMTDRELINLIFLPGFSTAEKVTNVSGRGVGMDVVKTNIEKIGGTLDVQSHLGHGTCIRIKIPLTLAIIPALMVTSGGDRYAIPQVSLLELVRLEGEQAIRGIEQIHGTPVYRLRGQLLPLVYLNRELGLPALRRSAAPGETAPLDEMPGMEIGDGRAINIVVLQADDRNFGLVVDEINDTEEIVVKPLSKQLKGISAFAGATIMGDGRVALILDVMGLAQGAGVVSELRDRALADKSAHGQDRADDRQALLLLGVGGEGRVAIPLSMVARLEEIPNVDVERAGGQEVVQYRGQIMPLVRVGELLGYGYGGGGLDEPEQMQVVVYSQEGRSVGLVVERILDIVEENLTVQRQSSRDCILGSAVVQQRVTDLLDVRGLIRAVDPTFFEQAA